MPLPMPLNAARVLFLCTGNYYRSRFAEVFFNHLAAQQGLPHVADSAGLVERCWERNPGPISPHTVAALAVRGINVELLRAPRDVTESDFVSFSHVIAMKGAEHRPMVQARFASWVNHVEYWAFDDIEDQAPAVVVPQIESRVRQLLASL